VAIFAVTLATNLALQDATSGQITGSPDEIARSPITS
jgi:hypothetical protein